MNEYKQALLDVKSVWDATTTVVSKKLGLNSREQVEKLNPVARMHVAVQIAGLVNDALVMALQKDCSMKEAVKYMADDAFSQLIREEYDGNPKNN